jgi:cytochrome P450
VLAVDQVQCPVAPCLKFGGGPEVVRQYFGRPALSSAGALSLSQPSGWIPKPKVDSRRRLGHYERNRRLGISAESPRGRRMERHMSTESAPKDKQIVDQDGCPVLHGFNPLDRDVVHFDPDDWYAAARSEVPLFWEPEQGEWIVVSHNTLEEILPDTEHYSSVGAFQFPPPPPDLADEVPDGLWAMEVGNPGMKDPPEHTRLRRLFAPAFSVKAAVLMTDQIREITDELIDDIIDNGEADLAPEFCNRFPVQVICTIVGAPREDSPQLFAWAMELLEAFSNPTLDEAGLRRIAESQITFEKYITALVEDRRENPREDDFVTKLLTAGADDGTRMMTDREVVGAVIASVFAGSDTTAHSLGLIIRLLLEDRSRWEELLGDRARLDDFREEGLRLGNPVRGSVRFAKEDMEIDGIKVKKGDRLRVHVWGGNYDPDAFPEPREFNPDRANVKKHLTFGRGPHRCPGANLARREIDVALETLLDRLPSLRLVPGHEPELTISQFVPALLTGIVCEWDERS